MRSPPHALCHTESSFPVLALSPCLLCPYPPAFWPGLWRVTALEMSAPWTGTFHEPEGIVDSTHCFEVQLWWDEGDTGGGSSPGGMERPFPLSPGSHKAGFSVGTWTWALELGIYFLYYCFVLL